MSISDERAAAVILRHLEWSRRFALLYVVSPTPRSTQRLWARVTEAGDLALVRMRLLDADALERAAHEIDALLDEASAARTREQRRYLWLEGSGDTDPASTRAWVALINRLNERREQLRAYLRGLIIVVPATLADPLRSAGPDLWSLRTSVVTLAAEPSLPEPEFTPARVPSPPTSDPELALRVASAVVNNEGQADGLRTATSLRALVRAGDPESWRRARALMSELELPASSNEDEVEILARRELARSLVEFGEAARLRGHGELAQLAYARVGVEGELDPATSMLAAEAALGLAELSLQRGDSAGATAALARAAAIHERVMRADRSPLARRIALARARLERSEGRLGPARAQLEQALADERGPALLLELGRVQAELGEHADAIRILHEASRLAAGESTVLQVDILRQTATSERARGHLDHALGSWARAEQLAGDDETLLLPCLEQRARLLLDAGRDAEARSDLERALVIRRRRSGPDHPQTLALAQTLATLMPDRLILLHFSDLHFGPHSRFAELDPRELGKLFFAEIERAREAAGLGPVDLVVVTGDLTEAGKRGEFEQAHGFFHELCRTMGLARGRFVFVPGNHDVSWARIRLVRAQQEVEEFDDDERDERIQHEKLAGYREFIERFYADQVASLRRWPLEPDGWIHDYPELRLSVALLNSCERITDKEHRGLISAKQAGSLMAHWRRPEAENWLGIIAVHHNPQPEPPASVAAWGAWLEQQREAGTLDRDSLGHFIADVAGFDGKELLQAVAEDTRAPLLLHGHLHATPRETWSWSRGAVGQTQVFATGSWGLDDHKLPEGQRVGFALLELDLGSGQVVVHRRMYEPRARADGRVELGGFVAVPAELEGPGPFALSVPPGFVRASQGEVEVDAGEDVDDGEFFGEYRSALAQRFSRLEFGAIHRGNRRPARVELDDVYVPLRLGEGFSLEALDRGEVISPDALVSRGRHLIIRGGPGSGKTTWMRWSFRRLLERNDVLPVLIELRDLARRWSGGVDGEQLNFEQCLRDWVVEWVGPGWAEGFERALGAGSGPRPVLMVDGWDELGGLGEQFRVKLESFARKYPRVLVIASSRPHGEGVPGRDSRFEELELQPLSDREIAEVVGNFHARVYASEVRAARANVELFIEALDASPAAKDLGRIPLMLVMLLGLGHEQPLPDQRHELYRHCLETLLDARPKEREQKGVLRGTWEWRPQRYSDCREAVAGLAVGMQTRHLEQGNLERRRAASANWDELERRLPESWDPHQRRGFLIWLVNGAGVMVERDDSTLVFAHLGFQEYLCAWKFAGEDGDAEAQIERCRKLGQDVDWWETLRLWAAILEARNSEHLVALVEALRGEAWGYWLVGAMLADGLADAAFARWLAGLGQRFHAGEWEWAEACAKAWRPSRQVARKRELAAEFKRGETSWAWTWTRCWRAREWSEIALNDYRFVGRTGSAAIIESTLANDDWGPQEISWGRVWLSSSPIWGRQHPALLGLRLWPEIRPWTGWLIQGAVSIGLDRATIEQTPWERLQGDVGNDLARKLARRLARYLPRYLARDRGRDLARNLARYLAHYLPRYLVHYQGRYLASDLVRDRSSKLARNLARNLARDLAGERGRERGRYLASDLDLDLASDLGLFESSPVTELSAYLLDSSGFAGTRAILAHATTHPPELHPLTLAARLSFGHHDPAALEHLRTLNTAPPWPALARHVARISTPEDRAQLIDLAANPDQIQDNDILRYGLKYWVRGDITFEDGSEVTLDELWRNRGLEPLPLLEDMPPELEIDWDADDTPED